MANKPVPISPWMDGSFKLELGSSQNKRQNINTSSKSNVVIDSETGEEITLTTSHWNAIEGRINLDYDTILKVGTGSLDISNRHALKNINNNKADDNELYEAHPLITKFMTEGPLTPLHHRHFNPLKGTIDNHDHSSKELISRLQSDNLNSAKKEKGEYMERGSAKSTETKENEGRVTASSNNISRLESTLEDASEEFGSRGEYLSVVSDDYFSELERKIFADLYKMAKELYHLRYPTAKSTIIDSAGNNTPNILNGNIKMRERKLVTLSQSNNNQLRDSVSPASLSTIDNLTNRVSTATGKSRQSDSQAGNRQSLDSAQHRIGTGQLNIKGSHHNNHPSMSRPNTNQSRGSHQLPSDFDQLRQILVGCKEIAARKIKNMKELQQAIIDEHNRENLRMKIEMELDPTKPKTQDILAKHDAERLRGKIYIESLRYDNEVLLITQMMKEKLLW